MRSNLPDLVPAGSEERSSNLLRRDLGQPTGHARRRRCLPLTAPGHASLEQMVAYDRIPSHRASPSAAQTRRSRNIPSVWASPRPREDGPPFTPWSIASVRCQRGQIVLARERQPIQNVERKARSPARTAPWRSSRPWPSGGPACRNRSTETAWRRWRRRGRWGGTRRRRSRRQRGSTDETRNPGPPDLARVGPPHRPVEWTEGERAADPTTRRETPGWPSGLLGSSTSCWPGS